MPGRPAALGGRVAGSELKPGAQAWLRVIGCIAGELNTAQTWRIRTVGRRADGSGRRSKG